MQHVRAHHGPRRGFTLVEMLVVITIIGVLVALLIPTVAGVSRRVRNSAMTTEINDIARAMDAYKSFAGDYPPDFSNPTALNNHMSKAFPRNTRAVAAWIGPTPPNWDAGSPKPVNLDPAEAIVFWLSLLSTNPRDPLGGANLNVYSGERKVLFNFDSARLADVDGDGWQEYYPKYSKERPFVYFDGRLVGGVYGYTTAIYSPGALPQPAAATAASGEVVRPMRSNTNIDAVRDNARTSPSGSTNPTQWLKPGAFQILCSGQDNLFGGELTSGTTVIFKTFPTPNYPVPGPEEDNLADFAEGFTLGDAVP